MKVRQIRGFIYITGLPVYDCDRCEDEYDKGTPQDMTYNEGVVKLSAVEALRLLNDKVFLSAVENARKLALEAKHMEVTALQTEIAELEKGK